MTLELLAQLGGVAAAAGLALLMLARRWEARLAGLALWIVGMAFVVPLLTPAGQRVAVAGGIVALAVLGAGLAFLFHRIPWALPFLVLAAVPARVPVTVGEESATLLIPLYVVVAGAAGSLAWELWCGGEHGREAERGERFGLRPPLLKAKSHRSAPWPAAGGPLALRRSCELGLTAWPIAAFVGWAALSAFWADDVTEAAVDLFFFILPFALLALVLARLPWRDEPPGWLLRLLVGMALLFAAVGIWQWATKEIFWNEKVMRGNDNSVLFRVNSLFWDPSIYGRFLVIAILAVVAVLVFTRRRDWIRPVAAALAVLWVGLLFSFSQSSFAALLGGLALLIVLAWRARGAQGLAVLALAAIVVALVAPPLEGVRNKLTGPTSESVNKATRGRSDLITKGLRIGADHPVVGVGIGNFASAYEERFDPPGRLRTPASHTTPVTVFAETGAIGVLLFAWLVVAIFRLAFGSQHERQERVRLTALIAGVGLAAIFIHALFYSAFLQDPVTWGLLGLAALAARVVVRAPGSELRADASVRA